MINPDVAPSYAKGGLLDKHSVLLLKHNQTVFPENDCGLGK